MKPDLHISIVNYNTRDLLDDCLHSIFDSRSTATIEVSVVDNGSTDGSAASVRQNFQQVRLLKPGANLGYGRANNHALLKTPGRYYAILNSDLILQPGALDAMVAYLDNNPKVGAAGGNLRNPKASPEKQSWRSQEPGEPQTNWAVGELNLWSVFCEQFMLGRLFPQSPLFGDYFRAYWKRDADAIIPQACGAFLVIRAELFNDLDGFDPLFYMYCEDTDLCRRVRDAGFEVGFVAAALAIHVHGQSSKGTLRPRMIFEHNKSRCYYLAKHQGHSLARVAQVVMAAGALLRTVQRMMPTAGAHGSARSREASAFLTVFWKTAFMRVPTIRAAQDRTKNALAPTGSGPDGGTG